MVILKIEKEEDLFSHIVSMLSQTHTETLWLLHVGFQCDENADSFECKEHGAEIKRVRLNWPESWYAGERWQILENVVQHKAQTDERDSVC
jgi:hypothetical protein